MNIHFVLDNTLFVIHKLAMCNDGRFHSKLGIDGAKIILYKMGLFHAIMRSKSAIEKTSSKVSHITLTQHVELSVARCNKRCQHCHQ